MQIKNLFDPSRDIYRTIEKVITYDASQETRLKAEISEYVVTESIEDQFEKLLSKMQTAMDMGGENDVGVWVSGFYGSGKSSFTKYLGLALDESVHVGGIRFLKHLQDRLNKPQTRALLSTVSTRYPAAIVMLDLASEMVAGATMEEVSTVLYYKVLQWAGYSRNLKVAALEQRLQKDGRYQEFLDRIKQDTGVDWKDIQNDSLVTDSLLPDLAHELYPTLFKTSTSFSTDATDFVRFENERVREMIDIVRKTTGKQHILFIIDEVGQYVGSRPNLILNLDGLAKNLKNIGGGKVWIIGTAQQTLTEDDPKATFNSPELYKLKDRFPIQIDLESDDIREICYRRLLGKSAQGQQVLGELFDRCGQALRHNTKLQDARYYDSDFDKTTFVNLYPFLPAHFDVLLHLLGALAKSTGGIGLRSAIKVIQDILVEGPDSHAHAPVADQLVGWLATTVTLYDALERDIRRAFLSIHKAVEKVMIRFPQSPIHQQVAKTVAILQILGNMPVMAQNIASLMHPGVEATSQRDAVDAAIQALSADTFVPFGMKEGNLCFYSEKINDIEQERAQIPLRSMDTRRIQNDALRDAFSPLPSTHLHGTLTVTSGLKTLSNGLTSSLAGEHETVQTVLVMAAPSEYDAARASLVDESRQRNAQNTIYLLGRSTPELAERASEIYRCNEIVNRHRNEPDQEVKEYCTAQADRARRHEEALTRLINRLFSQGSFVFRGQTTAAESLHGDVQEAAKKHLASVGDQVFDRYSEAAVRVDTTHAEKFLKMNSLRAIDSPLDPLKLIQINAGVPHINTRHKALISICDFIDRNGTVDGKRLTDTFTDAPFGWSQDTLRYLIAGLLYAGEIKLKVSGREITAIGQIAIDALRTNNSFKNVGVLRRLTRPPIDVLARAAERMTELSGDAVLPFPEDEISKAANKHFPQFQQRYGPLAVKLADLGLPGAERIQVLNQDLADILLSDSSDVYLRLGSESSPLYESLKWAARVTTVMKNGLEATLKDLLWHRREIEALPNSGLPGQLRTELADELAQAAQRWRQDDFHMHAADFNSALTAIKAAAARASASMGDAQKKRIREAQLELQYQIDWALLTQPEQQSLLGQLDALDISATPDLRGFKLLLTQDYVIQTALNDLKRQVERIGRERRKDIHDGEMFTDTFSVPASLHSLAQLDKLIQQLNALKSKLGTYARVAVTIQVED